MSEDLVRRDIGDKLEVRRCDTPNKISGKGEYNALPRLFSIHRENPLQKSEVILPEFAVSTHHISGGCAGDINLLLVMQLNAGDGNFIPGAQQAAGAGEAVSASRSQIVDA